MKIKIILLILIISIIIQISFSKEKIKHSKNHHNEELMPDFGENKNVAEKFKIDNLPIPSIQENKNKQEQEKEQDAEENYESIYEFREISFEDNLKKIINNIASITKQDTDQDVKSLLNYIFGQPQEKLVASASRKQISRYEQMKNYYESIDEIIRSHKFSIDTEKVRQISHDFSIVYKRVFNLNDKELLQYENNIYNIMNVLVRKFLTSFGLTEEKDLYSTEHAEKTGHKYKHISELSSLNENQKLAIASLTETNIQAISKAIVDLSAIDNQFLNGILKKLDIQDYADEIEKQSGVSAAIKVALRLLYSIFNIDLVQTESNPSPVASAATVATVKLPSWISETTIQDVTNFVNVDELFNPKTIVAFNKLFVPENEPLSKMDQETLTHQFIDLAYSVLYGRQHKYDEFELKSEKASDIKSIDQSLLNRLVNVADQNEQISKEHSNKGSLIRIARTFFELFSIRENYDERTSLYDETTKNEDQDHIQQDTTQQLLNEDNNKVEDNNNNNNNKQSRPTNNIEYISHRVNKLIQVDPNISEDEQDIKRSEDVFRIFYNMYLHYYGMEDENQLEDTHQKIKSNKILTQKETDENKLIQEVVPLLTDDDIVKIVEEIDRAAAQLGYKISNNNEGHDQQEQEQPRDLGQFEYPADQ